MMRLTLAIVAPEGISRCLSLAQMVDQSNYADVEVVVADSSEDHSSIPRIPNLVHLRLPGAGILTLRRAALARATSEWIVITEDHCKLMPGFFDAYRGAIRGNPELDLISGGVINASPSTPSSMANYLFNFCEHWPGSRRPPVSSAIANVAVRRSAMNSEELACDGGLEFATLPRLLRGGRHGQCPRALVDHVQNGTLLECCAVHFRNGRSTTACWRTLRPEPALAAVHRLMRHCIGAAILRPTSVVRALRGAYPGIWGVALRLPLLGLSHTAGAILGMLGGIKRGSRTVI